MRTTLMNQLQFETSPYLKQHAGNPVDWYPWREEALDMARKLDRPILLSIGYSTCHWCHVMAKECFEDARVAEVMNESFVNVKVDREERPDLDKIYQSAHGILTRNNGGWPLTVFLNPHSHVPFFAGTYFPKSPRFGLPGFVDVLQHVAQAYQDNKPNLAKFDESLLKAMSDLHERDASETQRTNVDMCKRGRDILVSNYDSKDGGFGSAPKFPQPTALDWLLRYWHSCQNTRNADPEALNVVVHTLTQMARGGLFDHLSGVFFRYSTDRKWTIPHFEKMLYDNALLLSVYSDTARITEDEYFKEVVKETSHWLVTEMRDPAGGLYAAVDADSEGREGIYYLWRRNEIKKVLDDEEYLVFETLYGLDKQSNFENRWHLHRTDAWGSVAFRLGMEIDHAYRLRESARSKLRDLRANRVAPATDTKVLSSWNGIAISGLAKSAQLLSEPDLLQSAQSIADFLRTKAFDGERLSAVWCDGETQISGYLDDYANVLDGLLTLLSVEWRESDIRMALALADSLLNFFYDHEKGGFWFTAHNHEPLIQRLKPVEDDSIPSGNGMACWALLRLADLTGDARYLEPVEKTLSLVRNRIARNEAICATMIRCIHRMTNAGVHVIVRGSKTQTKDWMELIHREYRPTTEAWAIPNDKAGYVPEYLPTHRMDRVEAFLCSNFACSAPIQSLEEFQSALVDGIGGYGSV